jgi:Kef-type K+ transport system membrane component KefB
MSALPTLLLQVSVILVAARLVGYAFRRIHQPQVMGEMVAGILLGPSFLGWVAPGISAVVFPPQSLTLLNALAQIGLVLFMFLVGLELQPHLLRERGHAAVVISHASILAPFLLGCLLALFLYPRLSDDSVTFTSFALFMGAAMSITAFPVLSRILAERKLLQTRMGTVAIACAAVDDVTGWCILAAVVLLVRSTSGANLAWMVGGTAIYLMGMALIVRRLMPRLGQFAEKRGGITEGALAIALVLAMVSAWATESLGIHALFGAFAMGVIMPKGREFVEGVSDKIRDLTVVLLLPLFFAAVGLQTSIGLVQGPYLWALTALIIAVAITGKLGGSSVAARLSGMGPRQSWSIGILMNTRGLMELVLLSIGLELGVLSPTLFTMLVLMALVTTFMTSPLLELVYFRQFSLTRWVRARFTPSAELADSQVSGPPPAPGA